METKYKILAGSIDEFNLIDEKLKNLPSQVITQIEKVEKPFDLLMITLFVEFKDKLKINLPLRKYSSLEVSSTGFRYLDAIVNISGTKNENQVFDFGFYEYKNEKE
ncbi:hypothetical protein LIT13_06635 [Flavobacterium psychrophilum]|uniref:hypothetical protein n=1 Tax=Flavobacterium psychrophilum TaxID=96345 RepID=UPI001D08C7A9|nr:hypothetical protein [Flavobacterium psychrophilum]MCB5972675.1 hypothetical protein [Flavobacterium psychrophilum]MCB5979006.1 hypothetical protein [Flavobacterium psychrophilum]MCB5983272.1 hypothetical protein [Flavobacterium psychrophilum]